MFSRLKSLYSANSHSVFTGYGLDRNDWVRVARGQNFPALSQKCAGVNVKEINEDDHRHSGHFEVTLQTLIFTALGHNRPDKIIVNVHFLPFMA